MVSAPSITTSRLRAALGQPVLYRAFGVLFKLRFSAVAQAEPEVADRLSEYLPCETVCLNEAFHAASGSDDTVTFAVRERPDGQAWRLLRGRQVLLEAPGLHRILHCLRGMLVGYVGERAPERVFVHAGVVGWQGSAIVLPGNSFAGKTTLVAALVRAGATYYSDEIAALDADGRVHPYARALQMRRPGSPEQRSTPVEELQGIAGHEPLPVGMVVFSCFDERRGWSMQPLTPGSALMEGMRHTFPVRVAAPRVMQAWARALEQAHAYKGTRGDATEVAAKLLRALEHREPLA